MNSQTFPQPDRDAASRWLKSYYFTRAAVAVVWFAAAFAVGKTSPSVAAALLVAYPAWDALANFVDAQRSGGLKPNSSQAINVAISAFATIAVAGALTRDLHVVMAVFGTWAILAGLFQLITGVRRWKIGAQWAMILAGAQSALVGAYFIKQATGSATVGITDIAPYAAFGALYFLISGIWLTIAQARRHASGRAA
ncbi:Membrane protein [Methylocella tundrae]|uniref:Membrane protein n=1 Tax=Methylocella tundrae TaxID=227605 RepID=A0A8B6M3H0_METTU|nr:DUF308 domain-containing protein [Methylocella tundrae]VTZ25785.1 Membrane protein [Methylocella tundrae]VTZ49366.1 Membrane protein [Methylocella tundrae]